MGVEIPRELLEDYSHRSPEELEEILDPETLNDRFIHALESEEDEVDVEIQLKEIDTDYPYFTMLGRASVPGEVDQQLFYPDHKQTGLEGPFAWRNTSSSIHLEEAVTEEKLGEVIERYVPEETVLGISARDIENGHEIYGEGVGRITSPTSVYTMVSYGDIQIPEDEARLQAEGNHAAAATVGQYFNRDVLTITTVVLEEQNGLVEIDYLTPAFDQVKGIESVL